jgi:hypothetical protein
LELAKEMVGMVIPPRMSKMIALCHQSVNC